MTQIETKLQELFPEFKTYKQLELELYKEDRSQIVEKLLSVPELKTHFFYEASGYLVFDAQKLMDFIRQKEVFASSYTKYKNKITLMAGEKSIAKELGAVVLNFPFKECVLEGGMSTEDKKRSEIFYNQTLAPEEITRLFEPKVLTNFTRIIAKTLNNPLEGWSKAETSGRGNNLYNSLFPRDLISSLLRDSISPSSCAKSQDLKKLNMDPVSSLLRDSISPSSCAKSQDLKKLNMDPATSFHFAQDEEEVQNITYRACNDIINENEANEIKNSKINHQTDNLLIKGNNLLALYSLLPKYRGKVKLIYIDPPYNTGNDGFKYNDNFNHSTWLVFMKNRLEVAKQLLADDGVIFVQIDNSPNETGSPEFGYLYVLMDEIFGRKNYVTSLIWKKKGNASNTEENIGTITENILMYAKNFDKIATNLQEYKRTYRYEDEFGQYNLEHPVKTNDGEYERQTMLFTIKTPSGDFNPPRVKRWTIGEKTALECVASNKYQIVDGKFYIKKYPQDYQRGENTLYNNLLTEHGSLKSAKTELKNLGFNREEFDTPKPEALLERIIQIATKPGDLVLDFFAGSGTTPAVAHKMGRRWIAVEQMDYIETITKTRLQNVLAGEQGGISKNHKWQGGGSFCYFELFEWNKKFAELIDGAENKDELTEVYKEIKEQAFWRHDFSIADEEFKALNLDEQKKLMVEMLNKNHLYCNIGEIADESYKILTEDLEFNKDFYGNDFYE